VAESNPRTIVRLKGLDQLKNSVGKVNRIMSYSLALPSYNILAFCRRDTCSSMLFISYLNLFTFSSHKSLSTSSSHPNLGRLTFLLPCGLLSKHVLAILVWSVLIIHTNHYNLLLWISANPPQSSWLVHETSCSFTALYNFLKLPLSYHMFNIIFSFSVMDHISHLHHKFF
jgi:hypothetical protein